MENGRVRIVDLAEELGVSTATVSNVIHGKTKKISDETVKRVQQFLEERHYIPSMAGILLAQNDSKIIGVVINDHEKYEGQTLEDQFISASVNALAKEIEQEEKFLMLKVTDQWNEIPKFASMWNMEGMVLIGYCEQDYKKLREQLHIPFVVYDGYMKNTGNLVNIEVDHFDGGVQAGRYLKSVGLSVPEDISVIGFDDIRECGKFVPSLTTIKQDNRQRASLAVKMLALLRNGNCKNRNVTLPVTLIERDSVCNIKMHKECVRIL